MVRIGLHQHYPPLELEEAAFTLMPPIVKFEKMNQSIADDNVRLLKLAIIGNYLTPAYIQSISNHAINKPIQQHQLLLLMFFLALKFYSKL